MYEMKWKIAIVLLLALPALFMWKVFAKGLAPFPGDLLVGAYHPWLEYRWGYDAGIPIKNPLISDVFSQIFTWKQLAVESYRQGTWPLWNPYTLSGYPLLANFHSGSLYIFNLLMIPNLEWGWNLLLYLQLAGAGLTMPWFLYVSKYRPEEALAGAVTYAFSGFALVMWQVVHAGHAMVWIPALLALVGSYFRYRQEKYLWALPFGFFLVITAGHFQGMIYAFAVTGIYFLFRWLVEGKRLQPLLVFAGVMVLSVAIGGMQLLPTMEMTQRSVRFGEGYIKDVNFGLLPWQYLTKLVAPDFFGHPSTGNSWGFFNYQETTFYIGIAGAVAMLLGIVKWSSLSRTEKFFWTGGVLVLLFGFDSPLGKLIYTTGFPGLSTSAAGRVFMLFSLCGAVMTAGLVRIAREVRLRDWIVVGLMGTAVTATGLGMPGLEEKINTAVRNLAFPLLLAAGIAGALFATRRWPRMRWILIAVIVVDLFRFGWKYTPFTDPRWMFPDSKVTTFLRQQPGLFRIEREDRNILPPNTWEAYHLMTTSGYDPMAVREYAIAYQTEVNLEENPGASRYVVLHTHDPEALGKFGVKYLVALELNQDWLNKSRINNTWKQVFESDGPDGRLLVLENPRFQEVIRMENPLQGKVTVQEFSPGVIRAEVESTASGRMLVTQMDYPGWKAEVNGWPVPIERAGVFQAIPVEGGKSTVTLRYTPASFRMGIWLTMLSAGVALAGVILRGNGNKNGV